MNLGIFGTELGFVCSSQREVGGKYSKNMILGI